MADITYADKDKSANDGIKNKWRDADANEVKNAVNSKLDKASTQSAGISIAFDKPRTYGYAAAETGNITIDTTGLVEGTTQLLIHNDASVPTFPPEVKIISGAYSTGVDNFIMILAVKPDLFLATISQSL